MVWFVHHDTIFGGFFDLGDDDGALVAVGFVEFGELFKRVVADDVGVQNKERGAVFAESLFGKFERASGAEGFGFDGELDVDVVLFRVLVEEGVSIRSTCRGLEPQLQEQDTSFNAFSMMSGL